jgi:ubiquitin-protein ligase
LPEVSHGPTAANVA